MMIDDCYTDEMKELKAKPVRHPLVEQLLKVRGLSGADNITRFINPDYEGGQHDPYLMTDMSAAVEQILQAV